MNLAEVFDSLAWGDLSNLSCVENGAIIPEKYNHVIGAVNLGLNKLYTRFLLKKNVLTLRAIYGDDSYVLESARAVSLAGLEPYIIDSTAKPFQDDIIEITKVTDVLDNDLGLNQSNTATLTSENILMLKGINVNDEFKVTYTAKHPALPKVDDYTTFDPETVKIQLPEAYLMALLYFVASRMFSPVGVVLEGAQAARDLSYLARYENECQELLSKGFDVNDLENSNRFSQNGFI